MLKQLKNYLTWHTLWYFAKHPKSPKNLFVMMQDFLSIIRSQNAKEASSAFSLPLEVTQRFLAELYEAPFLKNTVTWIGLRATGKEWLYLVVRILRPSVVLETGVASGCSSAIILLALNKNKHGHLHSIDIVDTTSTGAKIGWLIPESLKKRWTFHKGKSLDIMPTLLSNLKQVNIFLHDSDHSYSNMMDEFKLVWPYLTPGGVLLADDIDRHNAFFDFCFSIGVKPMWRNKQFGIIRKL